MNLLSEGCFARFYICFADINNDCQLLKSTTLNKYICYFCKYTTCVSDFTFVNMWLFRRNF